MLGLASAPRGAFFHGSTPQFGAPIHTATYEDEHGPILKICAYSEDADPAVGRAAGRRYRPWVWDAELEKYAQRALPAGERPLYHEPSVVMSTAPVFIFEREDSVDAFLELADGHLEAVATTTPGGWPALRLGAWQPLTGREVVLWPNKGTEPEGAMYQLGVRLQAQGCSVRALVIPQTMGPNFNLAEAMATGWTWSNVETFLDENMQQALPNMAPIPEPRMVRANGNGSGNGTAVTVHRAAPQQPEAQIEQHRDAWKRFKGILPAANGTPIANLHNVASVIEQLNGKYGDVWYDEFHCKIITGAGEEAREWREADTFELTRILQAQIGLTTIRTALVWEAIQTVADKRRRHEVREWLRSLKWDGTFRLALMLPKGWGTETTPYYTAVGRCFLVGAVARILRPGCQVDNVPVFEGPGGRRKTSALRVLAGKWFDNPSAQMGEKDFLQNMTGKWILELAELANIRRHELEVIKAIITRTRDTYRAPYARSAADHPRQCVFAGTIDRDDWNTDEAGGRRWWPVSCGTIDVEWIGSRREQLFAEAVQRFDEGEEWWNVPEQEAAAARRARTQFDTWTPRIARFLRDKQTVTIEDVFIFPLVMELPEKWNEGHQKRVRRVLRELGWREGSDRTWSAPPRAPNPPDPATASERTAGE